MEEREYIARISYGKDSLKMLEVIHSRGLPLDRITTTDVWAIDTISANLPPMDKFKAMMDERIWSLYHIEVEHLCARNKDGSKKTYEQMFYHVPVRKAIERERERADPERSSDSRTYGTRGVKLDSNGAPEIRQQGGLSRGSQGQLESIGVKSSNLYPTRIQGFPAQISGWCKKLKIDYVRTPFPMSAPRGAKTEISWSILE